MRKISITDSEFKIMMLLWENTPLTLTQIERSLKEETGWSKHTIISFLKRMHKKNAIIVEESHPARLYRPNFSKEDVIRKETNSLLRKLYGGDIGLMVSSIVKEEKLSNEEIDELMNILRATKRESEVKENGQ